MSDQQAPRLHRIAPEIPVGDVNEAIAYYDAKLGFRSMAIMPDGDYAIVQRDGVALHLFRDEPFSRPISFHVFATNVDALIDELSERGARITQPVATKSWGNKDFRVADPFGNEIKFTEPVG